MTVYRIYRENEEQHTRSIQPWTTEEIINAYNNESWHETELILTTENKEEAKAFFEKEKEHCITRYVKHTFGYLLEADILTFAEEELDEEGEFISGDYIDQYADPYTVEETEEDEEDEE